MQVLEFNLRLVWGHTSKRCSLTPLTALYQSVYRPHNGLNDVTRLRLQTLGGAWQGIRAEGLVLVEIVPLRRNVRNS